MKIIRFFLLTCFCFQSLLAAYEQAFPKTGVGVIELKTIPASRLIVSETNAPYFSDNNGLFRPLFKYISQNDIAMTTPVEAEMKPGKMYFYLGEDARERELKPNEKVSVVELPERLVASIGVRGSYSESNFQDALTLVQKWLDEHPDYRASGDARGIFWNGPFVPGLLKRFEVHLPVEKRESK